jgi:hypothetical protein
MTDFLSAFQDSASVLPQIVLAIVGGLLVWLGLCLWLGGLRWLKFFAGIAMAAIGYAAAYFLTNRDLYFLVGIPVLAALLAIFFEKTVVVLLTAVLVGGAANLALVWPTLTDAKTWENPPAMTSSASGQDDVVSQSLTVLENYVVWVGQNIYDAAKSLGTMRWVVYGVAILAVSGLGLLLPRGICALMCSVLGVAWIAAGMFFLLLYKGSKPADIVGANPGLFGMIAGGMVLLGMLINLAVAPAKARKKAVQQPVAEKG